MSRFSLIHAVREPSGNARESAPLLVLLHGVGSNEQDLIGLAPALDSRFFVVSVRAPITLGHSSYGWYPVQFTPEGPIIDPDAAERSRLLILKFVDELAESYNIDARAHVSDGIQSGLHYEHSGCAYRAPKVRGHCRHERTFTPGDSFEAGSR